MPSIVSVRILAAEARGNPPDRCSGKTFWTAQHCEAYARRLSGESLNAHLDDAIALHLEYRIAPSPVIHMFAGVRNIPEPVEQETGECFEPRFSGDLDAVLRLQVANAGGAIEFYLAGLGARCAAWGRCALFVVLILNRSDDLFQH